MLQSRLECVLSATRLRGLAMAQYDMGGFYLVRRCRLTVSKPVLKVPMVSALEATI